MNPFLSARCSDLPAPGICDGSGIDLVDLGIDLVFINQCCYVMSQLYMGKIDHTPYCACKQNSLSRT